MDDIIRMVSGEEINIEVLITILFKEYKKLQRKNILYSEYDFIPQNLIKMYYTNNHEYSTFDTIMDAFKRKYIIEESELEQVHNKEERKGLGLVYDYIRSDEPERMPNIYILLKIHSILFSQTPYPAFGGATRREDVYLPGTGIDITPWEYIGNELFALYNEYDKLLKRGKQLGTDLKDSNDLIQYINDCLILKCKLIKIHPFKDGNGRSTRALVNLLFKYANLPPIYVKKDEREEYQAAMNKGIIEKNYTSINKFYYYKICDSIIELDISKRAKTPSKSKKRVKEKEQQ